MENGIIRPGHVLTHVAMAEIPKYEKLLFFTDAAVILLITVFYVAGFELPGYEFVVQMSGCILVCIKLQRARYRARWFRFYAYRGA